MSSERMRIRFMGVVMALFSMTLLGGCTPADQPVLQTFVGDLIRNVAAALLL